MLQLCECGLKRFEEKTAYWLNFGKSRKCKSDMFRMQKIFYKDLNG